MVSVLLVFIVSLTFHTLDSVDLLARGRRNSKTFVFCITGLDRASKFAFRLPSVTCQAMLLYGGQMHCELRMETGCLLGIPLCLLLFLLGFLEWNFHRRKNILCPLGKSFFRKCPLLFDFVFLLVFVKWRFNRFGKV